MRPELTIGIPTCGRLPKIKECVQSVQQHVEHDYRMRFAVERKIGDLRRGRGCGLRREQQESLFPRRQKQGRHLSTPGERQDGPASRRDGPFRFESERLFG